jgi:hypothetical protein
MQLDKERIATRTPECQSGVLVVRRHHLLVRCSHWLNVPILVGLIPSGVSIYWTSPVYQYKPDPQTGSFDLLADPPLSDAYVVASAPVNFSEAGGLLLQTIQFPRLRLQQPRKKRPSGRSTIRRLLNRVKLRTCEFATGPYPSSNSEHLRGEGGQCFSSSIFGSVK